MQRRELQVPQSTRAEGEPIWFQSWGSFIHSFTRSLARSLAPFTILRITVAPTFSGSGHTWASFWTLFSYHPSLPIQPFADSVGSTFKIQLKFYFLTTSTASSLVQARRCVSLPTGTPVSTLPRCNPLWLTQPANQQKQKANQMLSLPCSEPSEIPVSLKARARVFPETYRPCMIWPSCLLPSPPSTLPLFIQCQPHWPPCYSKNYQTRSCPRALALTVSPAWNTLPPRSLHGCSPPLSDLCSSVTSSEKPSLITQPGPP